jgi:hypothetical protein
MLDPEPEAECISVQVPISLGQKVAVPAVLFPKSCAKNMLTILRKGGAIAVPVK